MFADLANEYNLLFYPAFDEAFVDDARLKLSDDLHPTALGIDAVVTRILPKVETLIDRALDIEAVQPPSSESELPEIRTIDACYRLLGAYMIEPLQRP